MSTTRTPGQLHKLRKVTNRLVVPVEAPERILVLPWGNVESTRGTFTVNAESAAAIVESFAARQLDLVLDYEHQTLGGKFSAPDGKAPAAGWIKSLESVPGEGIYAHVEWTERGAGHIRSKEYRYLSPVVMVRADDDVAVGLHSVALTNTPAINGMRPIVNKTQTVPNVANGDSWEQVRWWLNLPATATAQEIIMELEKFLAQLRELAGAAASTNYEGIVAALKARLTTGAKLRADICSALSVKPEANDESLVAAVTTLKSTTQSGAAAADKQVEILSTRLKEATDKLAVLEESNVSSAAQGRIEKALSAGKLKPADIADGAKDRDFYLKLSRDAAGWEAFFSRVPATAPADGRVIAHSGGNGAGGAEGGRSGVIAAACREFDENRRMIACSRSQYVNQLLRENKLAELDKSEAEKLPA